MINFNKEWNFIVAETRNEKPNSKNLAKREFLFAMQILLCKKEIKYYIALKNIYCKN